ncbi:Gamma-glutamylaminecyclotransferase [Takifugu flavidus]|uniref:Gamma-glutamylaminecyclotransferase n=1 Tax=Takifugu flavidus TaxID=433684 RepID=A0A5C6NDI2_9TELE|nr:Gamma-glutamylaminecyclotransferase [Takifugu flavidus]
MTQIFVYGTLKRGQPNHYRMFDTSNGKAEFLATACTTQKYPLVIATQHNIPFLLNIPGNGHRIQGEIYEVDEQMLKFLDAFEGVPTMYQRTPIMVEVMEVVKDLEAGSSREVYVYSTQTYKPDWPLLPSYGSYDSLGAHGLESPSSSRSIDAAAPSQRCQQRMLNWQQDEKQSKTEDSAGGKIEAEPPSCTSAVPEIIVGV